MIVLFCTKYIYKDSKLLGTVVWFAELVFKLVYGLFLAEQHALYTSFLPRVTIQEGIECTKGKEWQRAYCHNIYCGFALKTKETTPNDEQGV